MAECMFQLLSKKGTIIIEVQYLMNTLKDLTFDNIYHEHYNYWSLTSLINFLKNLTVRYLDQKKSILMVARLEFILRKIKQLRLKRV